MKLWNGLRRNEKQFLLVTIVPVLLILVISIMVMLIVGPSQGQLTSMVLMTLWMLFAGIYVLFDSKSRWPGLSTFERFANIITFKR